MCSILERMQTKILQCAPTNTAMCQVASRLVQERRTQLGPDNFDPCEVIILGHRDKMMELLADSDRQFSMELRIEMVARCVDTLVKALEAALVVSQNRNGGGGGGVGRGGATGGGKGKRGGKKGGTAESNHSATMATQKSVQMVYDAVKVYCKEMKLLVGEKLLRLDLQLIPPFDSITRFVDIVVALRGPDGAGDKGGTGKTPMGTDVRGDGTKSSQQTVLEAAERLPQQVRPFIMFDKNECLDQGTMERRNVTTGLQGLFLMKARSIFSTLNGTFSNHLRDEIAFNIVIVDEAAQATEAETTCIMRECVKTVILVGDPKQLESTVMSADCEKAKFGRSLMERLLTLKHPFYLLETQYRMHPRIAQFSSKNFYDGWLMDSDHVQAYDPPWYKTPQFSAVQFVAHTGTMHSRDNGGSSINELEANLICRRIQSFLTATSSHSTNLSIGIICPYKAQKHLLESLIKTTFRPRQQKQISVNTVDGFQGQERDVIILSLTRVGYVSDFLDDLKRVNVALTRAKFNLWVFGDHKTYNRCLGQFGSFGWFYSHCETLGFVKFVNVSKAEQTQYQQIQQVERNGSENGNSSGVEDDEEEEEEVVGMAEEDEEEEEEDIEDQQHGKFGIVAVEVPMRQAKRFQPGGRGGHNQKLMATLSVGTLESTEASLLDAWDSAFD
ncbi:hypothetical protein BCR33DRAFT_280884 [Rhizoclosmatium globosum]|uniref:P-loop containing nucleoside triphosphate hydrolase protein n=1 Tax=Rhizoclosmatium globosum TaxID=329046 RepID=A0A1Y2C6Y6_9FUNG|nr:hypothetical protein BCR33DRAFT_280884 [Rhizoclosmatium globosum]|eukprot:ORY42790.1 hypothetical protein BCR33DRAFT_280884 [Rhizoclosmatium globosum]